MASNAAFYNPSLYHSGYPGYGSYAYGYRQPAGWTASNMNFPAPVASPPAANNTRLEQAVLTADQRTLERIEALLHESVNRKSPENKKKRQVYAMICTGVAVVVGIAVVGALRHFKMHGQSITLFTSRHSKEISRINDQVSGFIQTTQPQLQEALGKLTQATEELTQAVRGANLPELSGAVTAAAKNISDVTSAGQIGSLVTTATTTLEDLRHVLASVQPRKGSVVRWLLDRGKHPE